MMSTLIQGTEITEWIKLLNGTSVMCALHNTFLWSVNEKHAEEDKQHYWGL
jgi:hypothetical protein